MTVVAVPYHLDERLPAFDPVLPADRTVDVSPTPQDDPWHRLAQVHERTAQAVHEAAASGTPTIVAADCIACLGALAGLRRAGTRDPGIVWFDAHPDFHTEQSSTSGYKAGMPLALAAGLGTSTLPDALDLRPVDPLRIRVVDGRDTDPGELQNLEEHGVQTVAIDALDESTLPDGPLYVHVDVDVLDPEEVGAVRYPVAGGPTLDQLEQALARIAATKRIVAVTIAAVWEPGTPPDAEIVRRIAKAAGV